MVNKNARGIRRHRDPERTRRALLMAGTQLFAERGYEGAALSAIADRARVNKALVSYYFGGKRQLYLAIVTAAFGELVTRAEALATSERPAPELLREVIALIAETAMRRNPHFPAMMLREVLAGGRHLGDEALGYPLRVADVVRRIVERGMRQEAFRPVDPLLTHLSLVGGLLFFFATAPLRQRLIASGRLRGKAPDPAAYVTHMQDLLVDGLVTRRRGRRRSLETVS
ncbi:MAG TPA: TetR/AcrR family transcriptional regulator [Methylomirabilota bacterium]|nr:TetR/AcrR family transcriptional regulator [Methylomirabilota bacterium]